MKDILTYWEASGKSRKRRSLKLGKERSVQSVKLFSPILGKRYQGEKVKQFLTGRLEEKREKKPRDLIFKLDVGTNKVLIWSISMRALYFYMIHV